MKQTKQTIFVSCGQRTEEERELGRQICDLVNSHPAFCAYFADMQSNLRGLNENILDKLGDCVGFVTVMHPRGTVSFSNGKQITRGSVWIEQEIAIAAHIQRTRKQDLRVAAYSHEEVERQGLRELLQLNPTVFTNSSQILSHLKEVLNNWQPDEGSEELPSRGEIAGVSLISRRGNSAPQLRTAKVFLSIQNLSRGRIREYAGTITVPATTLTFNSGAYQAEVSPLLPEHRSFRLTEKSAGGVAIFAGDNFQVVSVEIAVDHLSADERSRVLEMDAIGDAEADGEVLRIRRPLKELMSV